MNKEPVTVVGNKQGGGVIEVSDNPRNPDWMFHIMLRQGDRYAHMAQSLEYLAELEYEPGQVIEGGRILIKEQMEPFDEDPLNYLKMRDKKVCKKDGKPIYQKKYFTHNKKSQDIIIQED